jgi:septum formation protein
VVSLVLASASPGRLKTLLAAGVEPEVIVSGVDEGAALAAAIKAGGPLAPSQVPLVLARAKAEQVASRWSAASDDVHSLVLGCDSMLELDGEIHGKPGDPHTAIEHWHRMRGRSGVLHTGHWVVERRDATTERAVGGTASTIVHFADLSDEEIRAYVGTGEPLQVAGAFTVDGLGGPYITGIEGDYHAVVGISLPLLRQLLAELGVVWHELRTTG